MVALQALDEFGLAAYRCARHDRQLVPVDGAGGVLRCPVGDHRTDEIGDGVLGDGFDVVHRQWGRRGDLHAWRAMHELLATTTTPAALDEVRRAFLDGFREVADVDLDETSETYIYRKQLDHGGMSGGGIDVEWWRTKGIPLLVDRAIARRPTTTPPAPPRGAAGSVRHLAASVAIWALVLAFPVGLVGGGSWLLYQRAVGTRVDATVLSCDSSGSFRRYGTTLRTECAAEWTIDGRVIIGGFSGGNGESDVGKTVAATVRGDTAYSRSLILPILLIGLGLPFLLIPYAAITGKGRTRAPETTSAADTSS